MIPPVLTGITPTSVTRANLMLEEHARAFRIDFSTFTRSVFATLLNRIVMLTPVDTGVTRANWRTSKGGMPAFGFGVGADPSGSATVSAGMSLDFSDPFDTYWIANYLPHVVLLEFGGYDRLRGISRTAAQRRAMFASIARRERRGHRGPHTTADGYSIRAPHGMVRVAIAELRLQLEAQLRAVFEQRRGGGTPPPVPRVPRVT